MNITININKIPFLSFFFDIDIPVKIRTRITGRGEKIDNEINFSNKNILPPENIK